MLPEYLTSDAGLSGATLITRTALVTLLDTAERKPKPFEGIVVDDTSRLGRNLGDVLHICARLKFCDVFLYFVNQGLDSRDPNFYQLIVNYGSGDEQFLHKLSKAVKRGQKGRVLAGMIHGGRYYGYKNEVVPDLGRRGTIGRPAIKGVRLLINEEEAAAVRLIYDWAAEGHSFRDIALKCTAADLPRSIGHRMRQSKWSIHAVSYILHSELYRGQLIWGRTVASKNPRTGRILSKPQPRTNWTVEHVPGLQIIPDDKWNLVQAIIADRRRSKDRLGGIARTDSSTVHLLSGKLV